MRKTTLLILLFPLFLNAQKTYNITGISAITQMHSNVDIPMNAISKVKLKIVISDSLFTLDDNGKLTSYNITKRVNDNYFKATDGLKDYIITIVEGQTGKYSGFINIESDKGVVGMYYKDHTP